MKENTGIYNLAALAAAFVLVGYNLLFFDRYLPVTEGWFSAYADLISAGKVPYRDFYLFLPPLYPFLIAALQMFSPDLIFLRIVGIVVILGIWLCTYLLLRRLWGREGAIVGSLTSVIFYQSGNAHITYDYTQFFTLFALVGTLLPTYAFDLTENRNAGDFKKSSGLLFLGGTFISLAVLTKHSNGLACTTFWLVGVLYALYARSLLIRLSVFPISGLVLPFLITALLLEYSGALVDFIEQVAFGAVSAKGNLFDILFRWLDNHYLSGHFLTQTIKIFVVFMLLGYGLASQKSKLFKLLFLAFPVLVLGIVCSNYVAQRNVLSWLISDEFFPTFKDFLTVGSSAFPIACAIYALRRHHSADFRHTYLFLISSVAFGLIYGTGMSAGITEAGTFLGLAMCLAFAVSVQSLLNIGIALTFALSLLTIGHFSDAKFQKPYYWWNVTQESVWKSVPVTSIPLLTGMKTSAHQVEIMQRINGLIRTHTVASDSVLAYPHIPIFNWINGRWSGTRAVVYWYDFLPDREAKEAADYFKAHPPKLVIYLKLPESVIRQHEILFRSGKASGQRTLLDLIDGLINAPELYEELLNDALPDGNRLIVLARKQRA